MSQTRSAHQIAQLADLLVSPRCPICRHPLIARMGSQGPGFYCGCNTENQQPLSEARRQSKRRKKQKPSARN